MRVLKTKKAGKVIFFAVFLVVICAAWILWIPLSQVMDTYNYEFRELRGMPGIASPEEYREFPGEFEGFLSDHVPFRNQLVTLNSALNYYVFGQGNDKVAAGKDGWLFYCYSSDGDPIACYQGANLLTEEELKSLADNCVRQRDYLRDRGIEFVIFIAPNKERIYPEYMPDKYGPPAENSRVQQIVDYLRENTDLRVVYPYDELMEAKASLDVDIYYKTDTHWNYIGGYVGSRALLRELGIEMPELSQLTIAEDGYKTGDLARTVGMGSLLKSTNYSVSGYDDHGAESQGEFDDVYWYKAEGADPRKLYMNRDSFFVSMLPFVQSQFNESYTKYHATYLYDDFDAQQPDIFVYECVERYADSLARFRVEYGK